MSFDYFRDKIHIYVSVIQQLLRQQHTAAARSQQSRNPALLA
jgi:hypothetical protein